MPQRLPSALLCALLASLLLGVGTPLLCAVTIGQAEKDVIAELGEPPMKTSLGPKGSLWGYKHGNLIVREGKVVKVDFRSPEQIKLVEREEAAARAHQALEQVQKAADEVKWAKEQRSRSALEERQLAYFKHQQAILFNDLEFRADSDSQSVEVRNLAFSIYRTEESFIPIHSSAPSSDSLQRSGGGGGVGLSGNAGTIIPASEYICIDFDLSCAGVDISAVNEIRFVLVCTLNGARHDIVAPTSALDIRRLGEQGLVRCRARIKMPSHLLPPEVIVQTDRIEAIPCLQGVGPLPKSGVWVPATMQPVSPRPAPSIR